MEVENCDAAELGRQFTLQPRTSFLVQGRRVFLGRCVRVDAEPGACLRDDDVSWVWQAVSPARAEKMAQIPLVERAINRRAAAPAAAPDCLEEGTLIARRRPHVIARDRAARLIAVGAVFGLDDGESDEVSPFASG